MVRTLCASSAKYMTESTRFWQIRIAYSSTSKRFKNRYEWIACFHGEFSLWCRSSNVFCERQFAMQCQQPQKDQQNVDVAPPEKISADVHGYFNPFGKLSRIGKSG